MVVGWGVVSMVRIQREDAERLLGSVPEENVFRCCDGRALRDMGELGRALESMADETFAYHVNAERNDFSNWTRDIIRDDKLARDLQRSRKRGQASKYVTERLAILSGKL